MVRRIIIAGPSLLDKLPIWVALPLALVIGGSVGYWVALPGVRTSDFVLGGGALVLALWWGLSAPRGLPTSKRSLLMSKHGRTSKRAHKHK